MLPDMRNPAARESANRVRMDIKAVGTALDPSNPIQILPEIQSELLAMRFVVRHHRVSSSHARVICQLAGLGGVA